MFTLIFAQRADLLTLFSMGFFVHVKCMRGKIILPSQSKIFEYDANKLKITHKLGNLKEFQTYLKKLLPSLLFDDFSIFLGKNNLKNDQL